MVFRHLIFWSKFYITSCLNSYPSLKVCLYWRKNCQTVSNCVELSIIFSLSLSFLPHVETKFLTDPASQVGQFQFDLWLGYKILLRQVSHELCSIVYLRRILLTGSKANNDWLKQGKISVKTKGIYASTVSKLRGLSTCARCR